MKHTYKNGLNVDLSASHSVQNAKILHLVVFQSQDAETVSGHGN